jgi:SAM-dependent methyltransferase
LDRDQYLSRVIERIVQRDAGPNNRELKQKISTEFLEDNRMPAEWDNHFNSLKINHGIMQVWADYFVDSYQKYFGFLKQDEVLDFGAGLGDVSFLIKDRVKRIYLYEKSKFFLEELGKRFHPFQNIHIVNSLQDIPWPVSLIIINGVIHYMKEEEIKEMLSALRPLCNLKTGIIIADIVPTNYSKPIDALSQLATGLRKKFFIKLIRFIVTNILDDPMISLRTSSLYRYDEDRLKELLSAYGYSARRLEKNFSYSKFRYTLLCGLLDQNNI